MSRAAAPARAATDASARFEHIEALVDALAGGGLEDVCIAPGARSTPLTVAFDHHPRINTWSHIDERSAAFFALGIAKRTRNAVALVCTSGTAAANFFPAIVEAAQTKQPLIVLTADRPPELRDRDAGQAIDQIKLYGDFPALFVEAGGADCGLPYFLDLGRRALQTALGTPGGVVHINVPLREPLVAAEGTLSSRFSGERVIRGAGPAPRAAELERLANSLRSCRRGLVLCGPADHTAPRRTAIAELARTLGFPLLADPASQLRRGAGVEVAIDAFDAMLADDGLASRLAPEIVLRVGGMPVSKRLRLWLERHAVPQIVIDDSGAWNDPSISAREIWNTDVSLTCEGLLHALSGYAPQIAWLDAWRDANHDARAAIDRYLAAESGLSGCGVFHQLARRLQAPSILYTGNSLPIRQLDTAWPAAETDVRILCNRGANGIDGVVSCILGAAANSAAPVVGVLGDLSFYHDMNGLMAARRHAIDATIIVLNNDGGGIFSMLPQAYLGETFDRHFTTPHGLDLSHAARLYGCSFDRVDSWDSFTVALRRSLAAPGTSVIEVPLDRERDLAIFGEAIRRGAKAAQS